jgi:hypothetical protein
MKMVRIWSTETIRRAATGNGGVPANQIALFNSDGDVVVWERSGEVRTVMLADELIVVEMVTS